MLFQVDHDFVEVHVVTFCTPLFVSFEGIADLKGLLTTTIEA